MKCFQEGLQFNLVYEMSRLGFIKNVMAFQES